MDPMHNVTDWVLIITIMVMGCAMLSSFGYGFYGEACAVIATNLLIVAFKSMSEEQRDALDATLAEFSPVMRAQYAAFQKAFNKESERQKAREEKALAKELKRAEKKK